MSLHIPKTAGTSFRAALEAEYGDDLHPAYRLLGINAREYRAIHGHIGPDTYWSASRRARLITWLRDPAERIRSYYDYWRSAEPDGNANHVEFLESNMSLLEFAAWPIIRDEFEQKYIQRLTPEKLAFVGFTEHYDRDLRRLAELLSWRTTPTREERNVTPGTRAPLDDATRREIEALHAFEVDWYRAALAVHDPG